MYIIIVKGILKVNEMFCKSCGNEITTNDIFCSKCGKKVSDKKRNSTGIAIILIVVIAIFLMIFISPVVITMKVVGKNDTETQVDLSMTEKYISSKEILNWYTSLELIKTRTMEENPANVIVKVVLGYNKNTDNEIEQKSVEISNYLRRFFTHKTTEELRPQNEGTLKIEIRDGINNSILQSTKIKDVRFMKMDVIQQ